MPSPSLSLHCKALDPLHLGPLFSSISLLVFRPQDFERVCLRFSGFQLAKCSAELLRPYLMLNFTGTASTFYICQCMSFTSVLVSIPAKSGLDRCSPPTFPVSISRLVPSRSLLVLFSLHAHKRRSLSDVFPPSFLPIDYAQLISSGDL